jgi:hypothetical protein
VITLGGNEFGNKPPDVRPPVAPSKDRQAEVADWRTKFGFDKLKATEARAPQETVVDRRTPKEHVLKPESPSAPGREAYERSPVHQFEKIVTQQGYSPEAFRQQVREHPETYLPGLSHNDAELITDFARVGTVAYQRYAVPKSPEVDALVHKAVGKGPGEYVSQRDLDGLLKTVADHRSELIHKGLSEIDVDRVRSYLVGETGRVPTTDFSGDKSVTTSDGHLNLTAADAVQHDRWRTVNATVEAPLTAGWGREMGADLDEIERRAHNASTIEQVLGAWVLHTANVRAGIAAAEHPAGPPRIVPEAPSTPTKVAPERSGTPPDSGSYAKELFTLRDRAYQLALDDARQGKAEHGQEYDAKRFGSRVHFHFGELANQSVREGRLPQSFVVNVQNKLSPKFPGLDAWDRATGVGFDVTTATTKTVLSHEKHVGVPALDGTQIHEYLPLVYPSFKDTKKALGYE